MMRFGRSKWLLQAREGDTNRCSRAFHNGKRKNKLALRRRSAVGQFAFRHRKRARQTFIYYRRMFLRINFDSEYIREAEPRMAGIYNAREPAGFSTTRITTSVIMARLPADEAPSRWAGLDYFWQGVTSGGAYVLDDFQWMSTTSKLRTRLSFD